MPKRFIVMTAAARMPASCKGKYGRVAVVELLDGVRPSRIDERIKGIRIVQTWERQYWGKTEACAMSQAVSYARELAAKLNAEQVAA